MYGSDEVVGTAIMEKRIRNDIQKGGKEMLIEQPLNTRNEKLIEKLPKDLIYVVKPKYFDGTQIVQVAIDFAEIVTPSAITAVCAYLVAMKKRPDIIIKVDSDLKMYQTHFQLKKK